MGSIHSRCLRQNVGDELLEDETIVEDESYGDDENGDEDEEESVAHDGHGVRDETQDEEENEDQGDVKDEKRDEGESEADEENILVLPPRLKRKQSSFSQRWGKAAERYESGSLESGLLHAYGKELKKVARQMVKFAKLRAKRVTMVEGLLFLPEKAKEKKAEWASHWFILCCQPFPVNRGILFFNASREGVQRTVCRWVQTGTLPQRRRYHRNKLGSMSWPAKSRRRVKRSNYIYNFERVVAAQHEDQLKIHACILDKRHIFVDDDEDDKLDTAVTVALKVFTKPMCNSQGETIDWEAISKTFDHKDLQNPKKMRGDDARKARDSWVKLLNGAMEYYSSSEFRGAF
mmetsp:Transcript_38690/g.75115  ORF Transcript_38690/g.75115 Transcript_38690/m.75115 type:complete len:347 (+) Transcript_38690:45-1085(+)